MIDAVKSFQRANDLVEDGVMKPDGPTLALLNETIAAQSANFDRPHQLQSTTQPKNAKPVGDTQLAQAFEDRSNAGISAFGLATSILGIKAAKDARNKKPAPGQGQPSKQVSNTNKRTDMAPSFPPPPGYEPPDTPLPDRTESLPQAPLSPALKGRPIDEVFPTEPMIFLEISEELRRELSRPKESHRGDEFTERGEDIIFNELLPEVLQEYEGEVRNRIEHEYGSVDSKGNRKPQEHLPGRGPGHRHSSNPDGTLLNKKTGSRFRLNTANMLKDGETPEAKERRQLLQARDNSKPGDMVTALPKLRPGMDEAEFRIRTKGMLKEAVRRWIGAP